jgi:hypothetical protein
VRGAMRAALVLAAIAALATPAPAVAGHQHKKASGIAGTVRDTTCAGPCAAGQQSPLYTGEVTVQVRRVRDGALVASTSTSNGSFRIRIRRGVYDVSAVPAGSGSPCGGVPCCNQPQPSICCSPTPTASGVICPASSSPTIATCITGDTQRVTVRPRRFAHVELHVSNACVA